jgi:hypothetical protein
MVYTTHTLRLCDAKIVDTKPYFFAHALHNHHLKVLALRGKRKRDFTMSNATEVYARETERAVKAAEDAKKAKESGSRKPLFLWLSPGYKALIRPLFKMSDSPTLIRHEKWDPDRDLRINDICASELNPKKPCLHCQLANKSVKKKGIIFMPVYVYQLIDERGNIATYDEKQEDGSKIAKPIQECVRLLELSAFGKVAVLWDYFWNFAKDPEHCIITECDFTIRQVGEGTGKNFLPEHKNPKPMNDRVKKMQSMVTEKVMIERILDFCAPKIAEEDTSDPFEDTPRKGSDTDPAIEAVVQGVKNGKVAEEVLDDTIMDW